MLSMDGHQLSAPVTATDSILNDAPFEEFPNMPAQASVGVLWSQLTRPHDAPTARSALLWSAGRKVINKRG